MGIIDEQWVILDEIGIVLGKMFEERELQAH